MKFSASILLVSAAIATIASAAPLSARVPAKVNSATTISNDHIKSSTVITKRCTECTHKDDAALDLIVQTSAQHYAKIAQIRLDNLLSEMENVKVTSGAESLPKEKAALTITIKAKIDKAKKECSSEALEPVIKASVAIDSNMDIPWSKKDEVEKKMVDLDAKIAALVLERIHANVNAETLSKDCTENMTNTEIASAPAPAPEAPTPVPETQAPAPETPASVPKSTPGGLQVGIDITGNVDPKFVCKSGCKDSKDANTVLSLRVNLEKEFQPRLDHFYNTEVPTDFTEKRSELLGGLLHSLDGLKIDAMVDTRTGSEAKSDALKIAAMVDTRTGTEAKNDALKIDATVDTRTGTVAKNDARAGVLASVMASVN
ncbi:hypothetical protein BGZ98_005953 [Dissophora globulifera]|nr:hypothetical protein BGZ98_005953 [Dissophora globulifera]